jgi:hypothetical protein
MDVATQLFGAWVATYFASRATLWLLRNWDVRYWLRIVTAHALTWIAIALVVGVLKAYIGPFSFTAGLIYLAPQVFWAAIDIVRRTRVI